MIMAGCYAPYNTKYNASYLCLGNATERQQQSTGCRCCSRKALSSQENWRTWEIPRRRVSGTSRSDGGCQVATNIGRWASATRKVDQFYSDRTKTTCLHDTTSVFVCFRGRKDTAVDSYFSENGRPQTGAWQWSYQRYKPVLIGVTRLIIIVLFNSQMYQAMPTKYHHWQLSNLNNRQVLQ